MGAVTICGRQCVEKENDDSLPNTPKLNFIWSENMSLMELGFSLCEKWA
jgi:hypothetical protein